MVSCKCQVEKWGSPTTLTCLLVNLENQKWDWFLGFFRKIQFISIFFNLVHRSSKFFSARTIINFDAVFIILIRLDGRNTVGILLLKMSPVH